MNNNHFHFHDWEKVSNKPFEYDSSIKHTEENAMYLYVCLECEETKIDF